MEFLDGKSLSDRLKGKPLAPAEARRVLRQICEALEAAHRQGIVHRDLKPDNIWIAEPQHGESYAKLLDFGIAKLMGEGDPAKRTQTGVMMGTPAYMSPEQCRGEGIDATTDIYALGMILYEIFTGRLPFSGGFAELITAHLMTKPPPPSKFGPVPAALDKLILRCLEKDQKLRPQSADELGKALEAALPGGSGAMAAAPVSPAVVPAVATATNEPAPPLPDTLSPAPGRTFPDITQLPNRDRRPLLIGGAVAAVVVVAGLALFTGRGGGKPVGPPVEVNPPVTAVASPASAAGRIHVIVKGADSASVMVDGKLVAAGVREARVPDISPNQPHHLRVEAAGRPPFERAFTVTAGAEVDMDVTLGAAAAVKPPAPPPTVAPPAPPVRQTTERAKKIPPASSTSPPPAGGSKSRHRDGLVGDDIFDSPKGK
jgi:serine/threonine-protein kinase